MPTMARMEPARPARAARVLLSLAAGALFGAAALFPTPADGEIRDPASLGELARDADVIVIGRVRAVIPSLFSLPGALVVVAFAVGAVRVLRGRRLPPVVRDGLLLSLVVIFFGGLVVLTTGPVGFHKQIAVVG